MRRQHAVTDFTDASIAPVIISSKSPESRGKVYLRPCQTSTMELFMKVVKQFLVVKYNSDLTEAATRDFYRKGVLKHFTKFEGKHLCRSLAFNKVFFMT